MKLRATVITLAFILVAPLSAVAGGGMAGPGGGGGRPGGGGGMSHPGGGGGGMAQPGGGGAGMGRPSGGGAARPADESGFNLNRDTGPMTRPAEAQRAPAAPIAPPLAARPSEARPLAARPSEERVGTRGSGPVANRNSATAYRTSGNFRAPAGGREATAPRGGWREHARGFVVANPRYHGSAWGWNRGNRWDGYSDDWGDGFWGPFALGSLAGAFIVGASDESLPYYQVAQGSPGAQLLENYDLSQTPCGPPDLVVLYGPDGGTICAYPNDQVPPGPYNISESSLTLTAG